VELGIMYASPGGVPLKLDAYLPGSPGPHQGVILIHGGAFRFGEREWERYLATTLLDAGFAAFSIDYRLAPEFPFPAAVDDVLAAVAWVRAHAAEYEVDPRGIGAIGESAGGHLAAMLAVLGRDSLDMGSRIAAAVSWSGPMDLHALVRDAGDVVTGGLTIRDDVVEQFLGCRGVSCARLFRKASPVTFVDPSDAPMLLVNSVEEFIPIAQAREMAAELRGAGVSVQVIEMPGDKHAGEYANDPVPGSSRTVLDVAIAFLRSEL
jgi:acetyl esterase/lipase